jgi:hypothetical protein
MWSIDVVMARGVPKNQGWFGDANIASGLIGWGSRLVETPLEPDACAK